MAQQLTISHPLFELVKLEHQKILSMLKNSDLTLENLKKIKSYAENHHHYLEETLLFSKVIQNPMIQGGGPMCGLFFDYHLFENFKQKVEAITKYPLSLKPYQQKILSTQSPIAVPMEEHRSGHDLINYMIDQFDKLSSAELNEYFNFYQEIQERHFKKEEECFLLLCCDLLTKSDADSIYESWINFRLQ